MNQTNSNKPKIHYIERGNGWLAAPFPENEVARKETLDSFQVLDTPKVEIFDKITEETAKNLNVPIALISLVDTDRQWFKSTYGIDVESTPRDQAFCAHALLDDEVLVVLDATKDFRFQGNPLVTADPNIKFYAGASLIVQNSIRIGTLCVIDRTPRAGFSQEECDYLKKMASYVVDGLYAAKPR